MSRAADISINVGVHLRPTTEMTVRVLCTERHYAEISLDGSGVNSVTAYAGLAELDRLITVLTDARTELAAKES